MGLSAQNLIYRNPNASSLRPSPALCTAEVCFFVFLSLVCRP